MKKFTRLICLVLCIVTLVTGMSFVGCSKGNATGAYINMYLSSEVYNFDPAYAHLDTSAMKLLPLIYEGLMKLDDDGKVVKALCSDWDYKEDKGINTEDTEEGRKDDKFTMTIKIKGSSWSDGIPVSADDFVFAWKRLLEPDFDGEGAELLYDIKGAVERKTLAESPDDIGLYAQQNLLIIEFAHSIEPKEFLRKLTSVALFPLRENTVSYYKDWASASTTILTNGSYTIRTYEPGQKLVLERNIYYRYVKDEKSDEAPIPDKYVKPYRIVVDYTLSGKDIMDKYEEGQLFFMSELPADSEIRQAYKNKVKTSDAYSSFVCYFNTDKAPFNDPVVRKALSDVISRDEIVNAVVYAKASTGFVPSAVNDLTKKDSFADKNENKISSVGADVSAVKKTLADAGYTEANIKNLGTFYLTVRANCDSVLDTGTNGKGVSIKSIASSNKNKISDTVDVMVAKMIVERWKDLGFNFELKMVNAEQYSEVSSELVQYSDGIVSSIYGTEYVKLDGKNKVSVDKERADFDVIAVDYQMLDTTALSALSVFAEKYSGCPMEFEDEDTLYKPFGHFTGFNSEAYNKLIDEAYAAYVSGNKEELSKKLHEAEAILLSEMPVIPVFEYQNIVLKSSKLSGIKYSEWGSFDFKSTKLKNWKEYLPPVNEEDNKKK